MPSPFPGMDPYLEGSLWTTLHFSLGAEIVRHLTPQLRPRYIALPVERFVMSGESTVSVSTSSVYPDVGVIDARPQTQSSPTVASISAPLRLATVIPEAIPHVEIEIRDVKDRQLVMAIEILSPTNKQGEGYQEYLSKRRRLLLSSAHLLEIDLLHQGRRVPMQQLLPDQPYFAFLSRADDRPMTETWPIGLDQPLPILPIPLLPDSDDALLDLQAVFTASYDLPGYDIIIDYSQDPDINLPEPERIWLNEHLKAVGVR